MEVPGNLDEALNRWLAARERGEAIDPRTLCSRDPELTRQLTTYVDSIQELEDVLLGSSGEPSEPDDSDVPDNIDPKLRLEIQGVHARGGLGRVFVARDSDLNRRVAIKFPRADASNERLERFAWEAEVTSQLDHPGIVPVYAIGKTAESDLSYYVMRFVEGATLEDRIVDVHRQAHSFNKSERGIRSLLREFVAVCRIVHYAHERGLLHCDLKPQNVLIGKHNQVMVMDWGEALPLQGPISAQTKLPALRTGQAHTKSAGGTLMYRCPESLGGDQVTLTPRSDVYSLGVILFRLLVGRWPYGATTEVELTEMIMRRQLTEPRTVDRTLPRPLESICLKAMAMDPLQRYDSAAQLADDIQRWIDDVPVSAMKENLLSQFARSMRRHTRAWMMAIVLMAGLIPASLWASRLLTRESMLESGAQREASLRVQYMAKYIASELSGTIERSWSLLENHAERDVMVKALKAANLAVETGETVARREELQDRLNEMADHAEIISFESLFICSAKGIQVARRPFRTETLGKDYRHRDYFHGSGLEVMGGSAIQSAHRSEVYISDATGNFKIAFSVPVWDRESEKVIGVLGMAVELGRYPILRGSNDSFVTSLVDVRHGISPNRNNATILHTGLVNHNPRNSFGQSTWDYAIDAEKADELRALCRLLNQTGSARAVTLDATTSFDPDYRDPVGEVDPQYAGPWLAAFEPVVVRGREDLGFVIIVQTRPPGTQGGG